MFTYIQVCLSACKSRGYQTHSSEVPSRSSDQASETSYSGLSPNDLLKGCAGIPICMSMQDFDRRFRRRWNHSDRGGSGAGKGNSCYPLSVSESSKRHLVQARPDSRYARLLCHPPGCAARLLGGRIALIPHSPSRRRSGKSETSMLENSAQASWSA